MEFELIVRGKEQGVQINVTKFPLLCPSCKDFFNEIYNHNGSRYGQVDSIKCNCGKTLHLTDSDNIIEYIKIDVEGHETTIMDFKELFKMQQNDFVNLKKYYNYDIFKKHLNKKIELKSLLSDIEKHLYKRIKPININFPGTNEIKRWLSLVNDIPSL